MPASISSPHNPKVKRVLKLRDRKHRDEMRLLVVDNLREFQQAIAVAERNLRFEEIFLWDQYESVAEIFASSGLATLPDNIRSMLDERTTLVGRSVMEKLSYGERISPIIAVAEQPDVSLDRIIVSDRALAIVIDSIEKPGNLGAILRTADAVGVDAVLVSDPICDLWNSNAIRSSQGSVFRLPIAVTTADEAIRWLHVHEFEIATARVEASTFYTQHPWSRRSAIVLGNEASGLVDRWSHLSTDSFPQPIIDLRIPMNGTVDSLNVSSTAAVLLYDALHRMPKS